MRRIACAVLTVLAAITATTTTADAGITVRPRHATPSDVWTVRTK